MEQKHVGLCVIPAAYSAEIIQLEQAASEALLQNVTKWSVHQNVIYRRVTEIALHKAVLVGDDVSSAFSTLAEAVCKAGKVEGSQTLFSSEMTRALMQGLTRLKNNPGNDRLVKRIVKYSLVVTPKGLREVTPDVAHRVLAALEDALAIAAATPDAAFVWTRLFPNAEAEYAAHLAKEAAWRDAPPSPPPTPEQEAEHARIMARLDQMVEDGRRWRFMAQDAPLPASYVIRLLVLEEDKLAELTGGRARLLRIDRNIACRSETGLEREKQRIRALHARLAEHAEVAIELGRYGDTVVLEDVHALLSQRFPAAIQPNGVYTAEQARALDDAARELERQAGGEPAWLEELVNRSHLPRRAYATRAWRGLKKAARAARRKGLVLVWVAA